MSPNSTGPNGSAHDVLNLWFESKTVVLINCAQNAPLMLIAVTGNSVVSVAISRTPSLRSPFTVFLCSLAISDLIVGDVFQFLFIASGIARDDFLESLWLKLGLVACGVSLCTITATSVDRFRALYFHLKHHYLRDWFPSQSYISDNVACKLTVTSNLQLEP